MRYLENAFKFTFKNFLLAIPLLISMAIPALIINIGTAGFMALFSDRYKQILQSAFEGNRTPFNFNFFDGLVTVPMIISVLIGTFLLLVFSIIVYPATYGLINKKYETGNATLSDFTQCLSKYIGRYILYALLSFAIGLGVELVLFILIAVSIVVAINVSTALGIIMAIVFSLACVVGIIALNVYMYLWFPAVCVEDSGIIDGLKNSFKTVKGSFWPIFGITILLSVGGSVIGSMLGMFPFIGTVVSSVATNLAWFVTCVYYFEVYRAKTGRFLPPEDLQQNNFQQPINPIE